MDVIVNKRQTGKTTHLIKRSAETWSYIVCHSQEEAGRIYRVAKEMSLNIPFPITFHEFLNKKYHLPGIKGFLIDNADMMLQQLTSVPVGAITLTHGGTSIRG
ncbi:hypothetical protein LCGC14_0826770 [marine sediment metagenome]|uniref:Uncharacterized protein n=1 Tax=marine sediment metagenome TaxID=412755 RepID=A0A0F9SPK1_9ZZZZ